MCSKISKEKQRELYQHWLDTGDTLKTLGIRFGISQATVSGIISMGLQRKL